MIFLLLIETLPDGVLPQQDAVEGSHIPGVSKSMYFPGLHTCPLHQLPSIQAGICLSLFLKHGFYMIASQLLWPPHFLASLSIHTFRHGTFYASFTDKTLLSRNFLSRDVSLLRCKYFPNTHFLNMSEKSKRKWGISRNSDLSKYRHPFQNSYETQYFF